MIQTAFLPPDVSWSRNRSLNIVSRSQNEITKRKNSSNQRNTSPLPNDVAVGSLQISLVEAVRRMRSRQPRSGDPRTVGRSTGSPCAAVTRVIHDGAAVKVHPLRVRTTPGLAPTMTVEETTRGVALDPINWVLHTPRDVG